MEYKQANVLLNSRDIRRLGDHLHLKREEGGSIVLNYNGITIISFLKNGTIILTCGCKRSIKDKNLLNKFSPVKIFQRNFRWYLDLLNYPEFVGPKIIIRNRKIIKALRRKKKKNIRKLVDDYLLYLKNADILGAYKGSCLMCRESHIIAGNGHLLSHLKNKELSRDLATQVYSKYNIALYKTERKEELFEKFFVEKFLL